MLKVKIQVKFHLSRECQNESNLQVQNGKIVQYLMGTNGNMSCWILLRNSCVKIEVFRAEMDFEKLRVHKTINT